MNSIEFKKKVFSLSDRLFPMVARMLGNNAMAEDAIQDIMLKLWKKRRQLGQHPNIAGFVFLTARNYCIDVLKSNKIEVDDDNLHLNLLESTNEHEQLEWQELNNLIMDILKKLPEQQSEILILRDIDGYEFSEIADVMKLKIAHVRVLLSRARNQVKIELEKIYCYERVQK